jgi:predicted acylesterase/phospholipase RssA
MGNVTLFRSYECLAHPAPDCTIVQAVRATTARPGLFKSVDINDHGIRLSYIDSGLGCNNPTARMLDEAKLIFPDQHVGCIISVGTGQTQPASIPASGRLERILPNNTPKALTSIATDCERTAQEVQVRFRHTPGVYFRFNVEQGLQDTDMADLKKIPEVAAHARHYNQLVEVELKLKHAAQATVSASELITTAELGANKSAYFKPIDLTDNV